MTLRFRLAAARHVYTAVIDGLVLPAGEVMWRKGALAGIELMDELRWSSITPWVREQGRRMAG